MSNEDAHHCVKRILIRGEQKIDRHLCYVQGLQVILEPLCI